VSTAAGRFADLTAALRSFEPDWQAADIRENTGSATSRHPLPIRPVVRPYPPSHCQPPIAPAASGTADEGHFSCCMHRSVRCAAYHPAMNKPYFVRAEWDEEAAVWVASSDDVPGLVTEAETLEALNTKLRSMEPELLDANGRTPADGQVAVELLARRFSVALPTAA